MNENSLKNILQTLKQSLQMLGFWMTMRYALIYILGYRASKDTEFDRKYGTDTSGIVYAKDLKIADSDRRGNAIFYLSAPSRVTRYMIASLALDYEDFYFVDFGSGKGRVLLVASEFPFRQIIGIEISERLNEIASGNVERYNNSAQQCLEFDLHCMDATAYQIPERNTVFHFYHPFLTDVLRLVLQNIGESLSKAHRRIFILYLYHTDSARSVFEEMSFLKLTREVDCINGEYTWALYTNNM